MGGNFLKEKVLWVGIILVLLSWAGNYYYFQSKQLEHPIFLDHFYETYLQDETYLTFYYLSNKRDNSEVSYVLIDDVEAYPVSFDGFTMWTTNTPRFEQEFSHQYIKSVRIQLPQLDLPIIKGSDDVWSFENIHVVFSDGETLTTDIGKVNVYGKLPDDEVFESRMSSGSSNHRSTESMVAIKELSVEGVNIPFSKDLAQDVYVKLNMDQEKLRKLEKVYQGGNPPNWVEEDQNIEWNELDGVSVKEDIFPLRLGKGDWMQISMQFNPERKSYFEFGVEIYGTTAEGESFIRKSPIIDHPYLTQKDIDEIISEKQGGTP
jgi:hypothetical protein